MKIPFYFFQKTLDKMTAVCYTKDAPEWKDRGKAGPRLVMTNYIICGKDILKKVLTKAGKRVIIRLQEGKERKYPP